MNLQGSIENSQCSCSVKSEEKYERPETVSEDSAPTSVINKLNDATDLALSECVENVILNKNNLRYHQNSECTTDYQFQPTKKFILPDTEQVLFCDKLKNKEGETCTTNNQIVNNIKGVPNSFRQEFATNSNEVVNTDSLHIQDINNSDEQSSVNTKEFFTSSADQLSNICANQSSYSLNNCSTLSNCNPHSFDKTTAQSSQSIQKDISRNNVTICKNQVSNSKDLRSTEIQNPTLSYPINIGYESSESVKRATSVNNVTCLKELIVNNSFSSIGYENHALKTNNSCILDKAKNPALNITESESINKEINVNREFTSIEIKNKIVDCNPDILGNTIKEFSHEALRTNILDNIKGPALNSTQNQSLINIKEEFSEDNLNSLKKQVLSHTKDLEKSLQGQTKNINPCISKGNRNPVIINHPNLLLDSAKVQTLKNKYNSNKKSVERESGNQILILNSSKNDFVNSGKYSKVNPCYNKIQDSLERINDNNSVEDISQGNISNNFSDFSYKYLKNDKFSIRFKDEAALRNKKIYLQLEDRNINDNTEIDDDLLKIYQNNEIKNGESNIAFLNFQDTLVENICPEIELNSIDLHKFQQKKTEAVENFALNKNRVCVGYMFVESKNIKNLEPLCSATEELIPVMEVTSAIKSPKTKPPLRRTFSVEGKKMERKNSRIFGSQELEKVTKKTTPGLRKNSIDRSNSSLKSIDLKKIPEQPVDVSLIEAKVGSIRKESSKPRSEIVQEVTQRLYTKVKKKDASTDTIDLNKENRSSKVAANKALASLKLKEFTKRAITAYKKRNKETQTCNNVVRFKEVSTDSFDLPFALAEVKNAEMITDSIIMKEAATNCASTENSSNSEQLKQIKSLLNSDVNVNTPTSPSSPINITNSSKINNENVKINETGVFDVLTNTEHIMEAPEHKFQNVPLSFTKYLSPQTPHVEISNPATANPIFTSSVNINVSHNYINQNKPSDSLSGRNSKHTVSFPTPDLISNHNSVDVSSPTPSTADADQTDPSRVHYASSNIVENNKFATNQNLYQKQSEECFANMSFTPQHKEKLKVDVSSVFAPVTCVVKDFESDYCQPLKTKIPEQQRSNIVECRGDICEFSIRLQEPLLLKSIMKQSDDDEPQTENCPSDSCEFSQTDESLNKNVRFSHKKSESDHILGAMSNFIKEATTLMSNLSQAACNLEHKTQEQTYEFQINVNDMPKFVIPKRGRRKSKSPRPPTEKQTKPPRKVSNKNETPMEDKHTEEDDMDLYENKYDSLVLDSCERLEQCANTPLIPRGRRQLSTNYDESYLHRFPQPFSVNNDWHQDYSSLESNPTYSDYGSLPRRRRTSSRSPSAYLRHLTNLRQQIVETSREELLNPYHLDV